MNTARTKVHGLRIVIDGSCLGPIENGTQVQTLALVGALVRRDDVSGRSACPAAFRATPTRTSTPEDPVV